MEPKRGKYDTNPLDERVADRAADSFERPGVAPTDNVAGRPTREIRPSDNGTARRDRNSEAPTRRIDDEVTSYPSVFAPPREQSYQPPKAVFENTYQPPASIYQPPPMPVTYKPGSNNVSGLGVPERWAVIFPYLPFFLAIVAGIVELLLVPRTESRTRFHAAQGLALQLIITAVSMLLTVAGLTTGRWTGSGLFKGATTILLIVAIVRVWKGKPFTISILDEPRKWLDEKIKPRK